jgi:lipoyl-dependent peroxiredoxin
VIKVRRRAQSSWQGTVPEGGGRIELGSGALDSAFTLEGRVEDGIPQTNPEELIGAGHAGCFTMSLADLLSSAGHPPADLRTKATVHLDEQAQGFSITRIHLETVGEVDGLDATRFAELAEQAKATCPVSRALAGTEITLSAKLAGA